MYLACNVLGVIAIILTFFYHYVAAKPPESFDTIPTEGLIEDLKAETEMNLGSSSQAAKNLRASAGAGGRRHISPGDDFVKADMDDGSEGGGSWFGGSKGKKRGSRK